MQTKIIFLCFFILFGIVTADKYCNLFENEFGDILSLEGSDNTECLIEALLPRSPIDFSLWPGNSFCVSCQFFAGCFVGLFEVIIMYLLIQSFLYFVYPPSINDNSILSCKNDSTITKSNLGNIVKVISLSLLSFIGWSYYFIITSIFWNFISYMMLVGIILVGPLIFTAYREWNQSTNSTLNHIRISRQDSLSRRIIAGGILLGIICFIMFPNFTLMPQQVERHLYPSFTVLTPDDPLVLDLVDWFYGNVTKEKYDTLPFHEQMYLVDKFIYKTIQWKSDYDQYGMIGLLTSPHDVLSRQAGDCQGQAVSTASMLMAMGYNAWVVETPFHWWTYARENITGKGAFLNAHGSAGWDGSVLPQAIDMVYTRYPARCQDCPYYMAYNREEFLYIAPPPYALMVAWTGAHIWVRDIVPSFQNGNQWKLVVGGCVIGLAITLYTTYIQNDISGIITKRGRKRILTRAILSCSLCSVAIIMSYIWAMVHYPVTEIQLAFLLVFTINFLGSNKFNNRINTPK